MLWALQQFLYARSFKSSSIEWYRTDRTGRQDMSALQKTISELKSAVNNLELRMNQRFNNLELILIVGTAPGSPTGPGYVHDIQRKLKDRSVDNHPAALIKTGIPRRPRK